MKYEQILKELEKIEDLETRLKFLNKLLKETKDEELKKKIIKLMEGIISPEVQHYERSHYKIDFEPSETIKIERERAEPTPTREVPERVEPTPETRLRPEEEELTTYTTLEPAASYRTMEEIEEVGGREELETPERVLFEVTHKRRPVEVEGTERKLFETVHSAEMRKAFIRETPGAGRPSFDTKQPEIDLELLEPTKKDVGIGDYKTPDQIREEKMRSYKRRL